MKMFGGLQRWFIINTVRYFPSAAISSRVFLSFSLTHTVFCRWSVSYGGGWNKGFYFKVSASPPPPGAVQDPLFIILVHPHVLFFKDILRDHTQRIKKAIHKGWRRCQHFQLLDSKLPSE